MSLTRRDPEADRLLAGWFADAHQGEGSPWLTRGEAEALVLFAFKRGAGLRLMEARHFPLSEKACDPGLEILGADPAGENWEDHHDPARAMALFRAKLRAATAQGARLRYKLWLAAG